MTTVTVEVDKENDLPVLKDLFNRLGLKYKIDDVEDKGDDEWGDLSEAEIEGVKAGLADSEAGRVYSHEYVMAYIEEKLKSFTAKNNE